MYKYISVIIPSWTEWFTTKDCKEACKNSEEQKEIRLRECKPSPLENGGKECDGKAKEEEDCDCPSM